jgi:hypothetical protein
MQSNDSLLIRSLSAATARIRLLTRLRVGCAPLYVWYYSLHVPIDDVIDNVIF